MEQTKAIEKIFIRGDKETLVRICNNISRNTHLGRMIGPDPDWETLNQTLEKFMSTDKLTPLHLIDWDTITDCELVQKRNFFALLLNDVKGLSFYDILEGHDEFYLVMYIDEGYGFWWKEVAKQYPNSEWVVINLEVEETPSTSGERFMGTSIYNNIEGITVSKTFERYQIQELTDIYPILFGFILDNMLIQEYESLKTESDTLDPDSREATQTSTSYLELQQAIHFLIDTQMEVLKKSKEYSWNKMKEIDRFLPYYQYTYGQYWEDKRA